MNSYLEVNLVNMEYEQMTKVLKKLRKLSKRLNVPIFTGSQKRKDI